MDAAQVTSMWSAVARIPPNLMGSPRLLADLASRTVQLANAEPIEPLTAKDTVLIMLAASKMKYYQRKLLNPLGQSLLRHHATLSPVDLTQAVKLLCEFPPKSIDASVILGLAPLHDKLSLVSLANVLMRVANLAPSSTTADEAERGKE